VVVIFQQVFNRISGQAGNSPFAVVLSTLVIATLFNPLRRPIQAFIDRRFYRRRYNAEKTLQHLAGTLRDEVNLDQLNRHLINVVQETMEPESISLWLKPAKR